MTTHPSIYELSRFVECGSESAEFEAHVDACEVCAQHLSRLAARALVAHGLSAHAAVVVAPRASPVLAAFVALTACVAVLIAAPSRAAIAPLSADLVAPEGVHGTPASWVPEGPAVTVEVVADAGAWIGAR